MTLEERRITFLLCSTKRRAEWIARRLNRLDRIERGKKKEADNA